MIAEKAGNLVKVENLVDLEHKVQAEKVEIYVVYEIERVFYYFGEQTEVIEIKDSKITYIKEIIVNEKIKVVEIIVVAKHVVEIKTNLVKQLIIN